ncbi:muscarinic acetylcholine receptor M1-like [Xenia sp. Carnegie-2017]|uniref:muscarinic acetylcholine receptor M1-like n=1 Tax=Xenia sp. Carnegie-2017 TaxID=2897299 RepID=UPI001F03FED1|nr:muscarinic acetylcholine receptor M1-like [Xenia sp. Carnegie-2017]XP_046858202.1 muscarinic acetylcholine receptor M1-like [Xenia sp. Carnegie-2017]
MNYIDASVFTVGLLSMLTNGVLLLTLLKDPLNYFNSSTTYFIISLAVADLLTGMNACAMGLDEILALNENHKLYLLCLFWITIQASFLTLLAMSFERFLIVRYPIYCRVWITKKRVLMVIACIWCISTILGGLVRLPPPFIVYVQFAILCEFFLSVFIIIILYTFIIFGIHNSQRLVEGSGQLHKGSTIRRTSSSRYASGLQRASTSKSDTSSTKTNTTALFSKETAPASLQITDNVSSSQSEVTEILLKDEKYPDSQNKKVENDNTSESDSKKKQKIVWGCDGGSFLRKKADKLFDRRRKKRTEKSISSQQDKLTNVVLLLVGILVFTVLPYLVATLVYITYTTFMKRDVPEGLLKFINNFFPIELLNFALNPLVYAWRLRQYRKSLRYLFTKREKLARMCSSTRNKSNKKRLGENSPVEC